MFIPIHNTERLTQIFRQMVIKYFYKKGYIVKRQVLDFMAEFDEDEKDTIYEEEHYYYSDKGLLEKSRLYTDNNLREYTLYKY